MDFDFFVVELKDMERLLLFLVLDLIYKGIDCEYKFIFQDIEFIILLKSLIVIIGLVGSGKFIFLLVIVGEILEISGMIIY